MSDSASLRQRHAQAFSQHGWPTQKLEDWRYVPLRGLEKLDEGNALESVPLQGEDLVDLAPPLSAVRIVLVDGEFSPALSTVDHVAEGLKIRPVVTVNDASSLPALVNAEYMTPNLAPAAEVLGHVDTVVSIEVSAEIEGVLEIVHVSTSTVRKRRAAVALDLDPGSRLKVMEQFVAAGPVEGLANHLVRARLGRDARLDWTRLQRAGDKQHLLTRLDTEQGRNASFHYLGIDLGGRIVRHDINCLLADEQSLAHLEGVYALSGARLVDNHTRIEHASPHARSIELFKGVLDGRCRGVFNGKIVVREGAIGTDSKQTNKNLLLADTAEVDTKPELEIYADDVKCAHGATVGRLDPKQLFYLQSRGIEKARARQMLIQAFCKEVVDHIEDETIREFVHAAVEAALPTDVEVTP